MINTLQKGLGRLRIQGLASVCSEEIEASSDNIL